MAFNSLTFIIFLPVVFFVFSVVGNRYQWMVLLLTSYIFYGFLYNPALLVVLTIVILISYYFGRIIDESQDAIKRNRLLWAGVSANLFILIYYKYLPFIVQNLNVLLKTLYSDITLQVPAVQVSVALSFFIFSSISYLVDIYFRMTKPETNLGYVALYISFFPKLLQGPIERANDLLPQLKKTYKFDSAMIRKGLLLFIWGLFQKVVVADRLGLFVDPIYNNAQSYSGLSLLIATYFYAFQMYYDFFGYTNMALGTACLFNIRLTQNFNRPFLATSIADYWRRWHISLSRWILDYIFKPLQMQWREWGVSGTAAALIVTFLLAGIWHGPTWGYVVFGGLQGVYMTTAILWKPYQKKLHKRLGLQNTVLLRFWQTVFTFQLICISFVFFRAPTIGDAVYIIKQTVVGLSADISRIIAMQGSFLNTLFPTQSSGEIFLALCLMIMITIFSAIERSQSSDLSYAGGFGWLSKVNMPFRISIYAVLFYLFAFHGTSTQSFIYLQF